MVGHSYPANVITFPERSAQLMSDTFNQNSSKDCGPSKPHLNPKPPVSSVQPEVSNTPLTPHTVSGQVVVKVPVVLAETTVQVDLDSNIEFPDNVLEIKRIKKNLKVTQCRLLLPTNKLFIKGFVRKNIQYATPRKGDRFGVSSDIRSLTVDIPFSVVTELSFIHKPQFQATASEQEFLYFTSEPLPNGFAPSDQLMSRDFTQYNQINSEVFNEQPYCELLASRFIELDEVLDRKMGVVKDAKSSDIEAPFEEGTFTKIEEKMVVEFSLKVLQNQQVMLGTQNNSCNEWEE